MALNYDNDTTKDAIEMCYRRRKTLVNPIITWEDDDVWEFLNDVAKVPHCKLYDHGWTRLGCIGCPMSANREHELDAYPAFKRAYMSAFNRMLRERKSAGIPTEWQTADDVMRWWLERRRGEKPDKNQISMFDGDDTDD